MPVVDNKFERVLEMDDPNRCQAVVRASGQCLYKALEGGRYCPIHAGGYGKKNIQKAIQHKYELTLFKKRVDDFSEGDSVKSLRGEIGIMRMVLERILNSCKTDVDVLVYAGAIGNHAEKISKLVLACDRLEGRMGMMLDKAALTVLAGQFIEILMRYIDDPEVLDGVANEMIEAISNVNGAEIYEDN